MPRQISPQPGTQKDLGTVTIYHKNSLEIVKDRHLRNRHLEREATPQALFAHFLNTNKALAAQALAQRVALLRARDLIYL